MPLSEAAERWRRDCQAQGHKQQTIENNARSLLDFSRFLASQDRRLPEDPKALLAAITLQSVARRNAGDFVEWLRGRSLADKTIAVRVSGLSALWRWSRRKGLVEFQSSPWEDQTAGLKT